MHAPATTARFTPFKPFFTSRTAVLRFVGALDAMTVKDARCRIDAVLEGNPHRVIVDFAGLEHLDSSGVHALVTLLKRVTAKGGTVVIIDADGQPLAVLRLLKLTSVFGLE